MPKVPIFIVAYNAESTVEKFRAIPPPYPEAIGKNILSRMLLAIHRAMNSMLPSMFAYQFLVVARPLPTVRQLLDTAITRSKNRAEQLAAPADGEKIIEAKTAEEVTSDELPLLFLAATFPERIPDE
ncbi:MAG TPA: hypothetical protein VGP72_07880 [Planctomycetota bacterium]|jgi:hypothetical protein